MCDLIQVCGVLVQWLSTHVPFTMSAWEWSNSQFTQGSGYQCGQIAAMAIEDYSCIIGSVPSFNYSWLAKKVTDSVHVGSLAC